MSGSFWGISIKNGGKEVAFVPPPDEAKLHISQACLAPGSKPGSKAAVLIKVIDKEDEDNDIQLAICSLKEGVNEFASLDLVLDQYSEFSIVGNAEVHLTGYYMPNFEVGEDEEEEDYDDDLAYADELEQDEGRALLGFDDEGNPIFDDEYSTDDDSDYMSPDSDGEFDDEDDGLDAVFGLDGGDSGSDEDSEEEEEEDSEEEDSEEEAEEEDLSRRGIVIEDITDSEKQEDDKKAAAAANGKKKEAAANEKKRKADEEQQKAAAAKAAKQAKTEEKKQPKAAAKKAVAEPAAKPEKAPKVQRFPNGFEIENVKLGRADGKIAKPGKKIVVKYVGKLKNGKIFDQTSGSKTFSFRLGVGEVIKGWDRGFNEMRVGDKRKLTIPPAMGYGSSRVGDIPPNSTLYFDVELVDVKG